MTVLDTLEITAETTTRTETVAASSDPSRRSKVVLAADDYLTNLDLVREVVTAAGYHFVGAESGTELLALAWKVSPRVVLLDIQMPGLDGFETCRRLREMAAMGTQYHKLATVPILFLTARKSVENVRECMAVGGNDFIIKPFDTVKLATRIEYWMSYIPAKRPVPRVHG